jgi:hypothetical protein
MIKVIHLVILFKPKDINGLVIITIKLNIKMKYLNG